jgi:lipopolysaccharide export system permease protein
MLKNKIYNYLVLEIFKNFITIVLTFSAIAWTVKAVNFLDLMIEDGYSAKIYFQYSLLNITSIISRFVPLSFLLSLIISITKFERQQELQILWTTGLSKIKIINIFFLLGFFIAILQIILSLIINPFALNESRTLLRETANKQVNSILKANDFSDAFKGVTFYIDKKNSNNELINIFIKDTSGNLNTILNKSETSNNTSIFAEKGVVTNNKLILFNGRIQSLNNKKKIENINFEKTELSLNNLSTRTITQPKMQETSSYFLFQCLRNKIPSSKLKQNLQICPQENKKAVTEALSRRMGMPLYIPLVSIIASFLLVRKKEKRNNFIEKYVVFISAFIILIFAEILLKYSGFSQINFVLYFFSPLILSSILYTLLIKNTENKTISQ